MWSSRSTATCTIRRTPLLHADDLAAVRGDGVFETLLVRDGRACLIEAHLQRLTQSAAADRPARAGSAALAARDRRGRAAAGAAGSGDEGAMRLVYSRGRESGSAPTRTSWSRRCPTGSPRSAATGWRR